MKKRWLLAAAAALMFVGTRVIHAMMPQPNPDQLWQFITQESACDA